MSTIPVSLQMYTLREESAQDFPGTLKKVAEIGYEGVELAGYYGLSATELKNILDSIGLVVSGNHIKLVSLEEELDNEIEFQQIIGNTRMICPAVPSFKPAEGKKTADDYRRLAELLNTIGEKCHSQGMEFIYHNHNWELEYFDGVSGLEILYRETNPQWLKAELDVYWLKRAGEDPVDWMKRYAGRTPLIHLKDMTVDGEQFFAELGTGGIDLKAIIQQGDHSGVQWWVVEQDQSRRNPIQSVTISFNYLKENKLARIK